MAWPLRDLFLAHVEFLKEDARKCYTDDLMVWAMTAPHAKKQQKPPQLPKILR